MSPKFLMPHKAVKGEKQNNSDRQEIKHCDIAFAWQEIM
jgi:hypothetical protein